MHALFDKLRWPPASGGWACVLLLAGAAAVAPFAAADEPSGPSAREVIDAVVAHLPREPLLIAVQLATRSRSGRIDRRFNTEIFMDFGAEPTVTRYLVRDHFGTDLEQLTLRRGRDGAVEAEYASGRPLQPAPAPKLSAAIQESDLSWGDLSLSFLWWPGGRHLGAERVKGRACDIVELDAPADHDYARVVLWIDSEFHMLLRAEAYDAEGALLRRLAVKSFKKSDNLWIIQNMDVERFSPRRKTTFRVRDVTPVASPPAL